MPSEDMDITTDFSAIHGGATEDIDIDLEFASGQHDEDLELGDFNGDDLHNFNSDTRDELMAEDEDVSFAMVDAEEIEVVGFAATPSNYDDLAATPNNYDIEVGDPHDSFWQQGGSEVLNEPTGEPDEINYAVNIGHQEENDESSHANEGDFIPELVAVPKGDEHESAPLQSVQNALGDEIETLDVGAGQEFVTQATEAAPDEEVSDRAVTQQTDAGSSHVDFSNNYDDGAGDYYGAQQNPTAFGDEHIPVDESAGIPDAQPGLDEGAGQFEDDHAFEQENESGPLDQEQEQISAEHYLAEGENPQWVQGSIGYDFDDGTEQDSGAESGDHGSGAQEEVAGSPHAIGLGAQGMPPSIGGTEEFVTDGDDPGDEPAPHAAKNNYERPKTTTNVGPTGPHLNVLVNYGQTEYRLFAKSEDDDPNQYFLNDTSTLELPLSGFLSSLREVISEELSPLDELVIHIDGLGLEFGETMNSDFLESNSFGDILTIWDILVQNDDARDVPTIYVYLIVRPNCGQRLATLVNQANSGGTLAEVAVYRQTATTHAPAGPAEPTLPTNKPEDESYSNDEEETSPEREEDEAVDYDENEYGETEEITNQSAGDDAADDGLEDDHPVMGPSEQGDDDNGDDKYYLPNDAAAPDADLPNNDEAYHQPINSTINADTHGPNSGEVVQAEAPGSAGSHSSSGTVTLNGDEKDEIDYLDDNTGPVEIQDVPEVEAGQDQGAKPASSGTPQVPDDEITWESDNEDPSTELTTEAAKESVQVSPSTKKRDRSDQGEQSDAKRHRS